MKIIKRIIILGLLLLILVFGIVFTLHYIHTSPTIFNRPSKLTGKVVTMEVIYINWACDCPDFIAHNYYKTNPKYEAKVEDCIYLEPSNASIKIPESYYERDHFKKRLRIKGQFYQNKGIPKFYEMKTDGEKPEWAKVFRYDKIEMIENDR